MLNRQPVDFLEFSSSHMWTIVFTHHKTYKFVFLDFNLHDKAENQKVQS